MGITLDDTLRNAQVVEVYNRINTGAGIAQLVLMKGTRPADPSVAYNGADVLATLTWDSGIGTSPAGDTISFAALTDEASAAAGTCAWARIEDKDGNGVVDLYVTATAGGGDIELNSTTIAANAVVSITNLTYSVANPANPQS